MVISVKGWVKKMRLKVKVSIPLENYLLKLVLDTWVPNFIILLYYEQPTPVLLPGKSHGRRSLVGFSPGGCEESDMTERLHFHFSLWCIGEGNGNPLQCSCLENPRDGRAWWAAIYEVAQSRTRLKWLSSMHIMYFLVCITYFTIKS